MSRSKRVAQFALFVCISLVLVGVSNARNKGDVTIITENKGEAYFLTKDAPVSGVLYCDDSVIKGSDFVSKLVVMPGPANNNMVWASEGCHKHDFSEMIYFSGIGAPADDTEADRVLSGEIEIWIGDEKHIITKTSVIFIPKGLMHGPIIYRRVNKPILEVRVADSPKYTRDMIEGLSIEGKEPVDRAKAKYGALIYDNVEDHDLAIYRDIGSRAEELNSNLMQAKTVKGIFYGYYMTMMPSPPIDGVVFSFPQPHTHDSGHEYFFLFGTDVYEPDKLGATVDFTANGRTDKLTKSCIVFTPKGIPHCPITWTSISQPMRFLALGAKPWLTEWATNPYEL